MFHVRYHILIILALTSASVAFVARPTTHNKNAYHFRAKSPNSVLHGSLSGLFGFTQTPSDIDPLYNRHSASDWLYNVRSFPQSKVLREIRNPVLAAAWWGFAVSVVHKICAISNSRCLNVLAAHMSIPGTAHSFLVSALGLLLVFRTNSAYQRFNVSRKIPRTKRILRYCAGEKNIAKVCCDSYFIFNYKLYA